eukprot:4424045-Amphidinium_carterae.1
MPLTSQDGSWSLRLGGCRNKVKVQTSRFRGLAILCLRRSKADYDAMGVERILHCRLEQHMARQVGTSVHRYLENALVPGR